MCKTWVVWSGSILFHQRTTRSGRLERAALSRFSMDGQKGEVKRKVGNEGQLTLVFDRWGQKQGFFSLTCDPIGAVLNDTLSPHLPYLVERLRNSLFSRWNMWFFFLSKMLEAFFPFDARGNNLLMWRPLTTVEYCFCSSAVILGIYSSYSFYCRFLLSRCQKCCWQNHLFSRQCPSWTSGLGWIIYSYGLNN